MAAAQVRGFQDGLGEGRGLLSGPKHLAGYGASIGGRDYDEVNLSEYELRNTYLPPFKAALDAGAKNIMTAYIPLNGVPTTANKWLLGDVLRDEWRFDGFVVSDANSVRHLVTHGFSTDLGEAAVSALEAGVDMEMAMGTTAFEGLPALAAAGLVDEALIDQAVERVLRAKIEAGVLDEPYVDEAQSRTILSESATRTLAQKAARCSAVLLKNDCKLLPLKIELRTIAIVGPLADSKRDILGPWAFEHDDSETITVVEGLKAALPDRVIRYAPGVAMPSRTHPWPFDAVLGVDDADVWAGFNHDQELERAVQLVRDSDVAVIVVGERYNMIGEIASRASLDLPGRQMSLLRAAAQTGTPVVLLVMSGRPLDLVWAQENVQSILQIWYPGTCGGAAVAELLTGSASPGGKLPFSWPRNAGQMPLSYTHVRSQEPENQARRYWDQDGSPLYPFGFGLSYGDFRYSELDLSSPVVKPGELLRVSLCVANDGSVEADEVVQVYLGQRHGSAVRPMRELKAFKRITLSPGECARVVFDLDGSARRYWSATKGDWVEDSTVFDVWVGGDATASKHACFQVTAEAHQSVSDRLSEAVIASKLGGEN